MGNHTIQLLLIHVISVKMKKEMETGYTFLISITPYANNSLHESLQLPKIGSSFLVTKHARNSMKLSTYSNMKKKKKKAPIVASTGNSDEASSVIVQRSGARIRSQSNQ